MYITLGCFFTIGSIACCIALYPPSLSFSHSQLQHIPQERRVHGERHHDHDHAADGPQLPRLLPHREDQPRAASPRHVLPRDRVLPGERDAGFAERRRIRWNSSM